jgi:hypothetical protein
VPGSGAARRTEPCRAAGRHWPPAVLRRCVVFVGRSWKVSMLLTKAGVRSLAASSLGWEFEIQISSGPPWGPPSGGGSAAGSRKPPVRTQLLPASPCFLTPPFERSCFQQRLPCRVTNPRRGCCRSASPTLIRGHTAVQSQLLSSIGPNS